MVINLAIQWFQNNTHDINDVRFACIALIILFISEKHCMILSKMQIIFLFPRKCTHNEYLLIVTEFIPLT